MCCLKRAAEKGTGTGEATQARCEASRTTVLLHGQCSVKVGSLLPGCQHICEEMPLKEAEKSLGIGASRPTQVSHFIKLALHPQLPP